MNFVDSKYNSSIKGLIESIYQIIMRMTQLIIKCAPIGVFGLMTKTVSNTGLSIFKELGLYAFTIACGLSIHLFIVLPLILLIFVKVNPIKHFQAMASAMVTAFSTSSSSATLPVTIKCVKDNVKASNEVTSFVLPMGATINMDGTAIMQGVATVFIANAYSIDLSLVDYLMVILTATLASIGTAGVPGVGIIMLAMVLSQVGLPAEGIGLIIGVDRLLDMVRTVVNVTGDSTVSIIVAKSENQLDRKSY